jgi:hypothetical protein
MPLLAVLLGNAFTGLTAFFGAILAKKVAIALALGTLIVAGWVGLQGAVILAWSAIGWAMPPSLAGAMQLTLYLLPTNFFPCVTALITMHVAKWVWQEQKDYAKAISFIT